MEVIGIEIFFPQLSLQAPILLLQFDSIVHSLYIIV